MSTPYRVLPSAIPLDEPASSEASLTAYRTVRFETAAGGFVGEVYVPLGKEHFKPVPFPALVPISRWTALTRGKR